MLKLILLFLHSPFVRVFFIAINYGRSHECRIMNFKY
nr:MAG TPA: hypothetical protein [Caudoviricetes sp.]